MSRKAQLQWDGIGRNENGGIKTQTCMKKVIRGSSEKLNVVIIGLQMVMKSFLFSIWMKNVCLFRYRTNRTQQT